MNYQLRKSHPRSSNGDGYITKDGHTMMQLDILTDLERKEYLENKQQSQALYIKRLEAALEYISECDSVSGEDAREMRNKAKQALEAKG